MSFTERDLPVLGVTWRYFPTEREAKRFASWAEKTTRAWEYPCEAFITARDDMPAGERFEVKVRNW